MFLLQPPRRKDVRTSSNSFYWFLSPAVFSICCVPVVPAASYRSCSRETSFSGPPVLFFDLWRDAHTRRDEKQIANQELGKLGNKGQARKNKETKLHATDNKNQKKFFTHNKEKATRKALQGVKAMKTNFERSHTQGTTRTNITMRRKPHEIALGGLKR